MTATVQKDKFSSLVHVAAILHQTKFDLFYGPCMWARQLLNTEMSMLA